LYLWEYSSNFSVAPCNWVFFSWIFPSNSYLRIFVLIFRNLILFRLGLFGISRCQRRPTSSSPLLARMEMSQWKSLQINEKHTQINRQSEMS
jgi:hypothetical protein